MEAVVMKRRGRRPNAPPVVVNGLADAEFLKANPIYKLDGETGDISIIGNELTLKDFLRTPIMQIRLRYRETLTKTEALEELAKIRAVSTIAAEEINQRLVPDEDECLVCKKILPLGTKVTQMVNVKDTDTGTSQTRVLCSINCVREWNRVKMGLAELVK